MRLVVAGAGGRMGRSLIEAVIKAPDLSLVAALEAPGSSAVGKDAGEFAGSSCGIRIDTTLPPQLRADCMIDFTNPQATVEHLDICLRGGIKMVIGTTGFSDQQRLRIEAGAEKIAIVFAPNMAVGVNVAFRLAETAARALGDGYDIEILEAHHRNKLDAPSGTALRFGELVASALGRELKEDAVHGREGQVGIRPSRAIGFHAIRGGDIVGEHTVMFAGEGERVEITVRSGSRSTYALGALRAARFLMGTTRGLYDMQDVLGLR